MKVRKVKVGIKDIHTALNEFVEAGNLIQEGKPIKAQKGVYFASIEAFREALTPKRLKILHTIKKEKPLSVIELSEMMDQNIDDLLTDIRFLAQVGLIDMKQSIKAEAFPCVSYDKILFEIAVL